MSTKSVDFAVDWTRDVTSSTAIANDRTDNQEALTEMHCEIPFSAQVGVEQETEREKEPLVSTQPVLMDQPSVALQSDQHGSQQVKMEQKKRQQSINSSQQQQQQQQQQMDPGSKQQRTEQGISSIGKTFKLRYVCSVAP